MAYYFCIVGTQDNPLFEYEFGTSKHGGDGQAHFREQVRHLNQFILHSSLDIAEEVQWTNGQMYLKCIDRFFNNYVSCFVTGNNTKFLLLHQPISPGGASSSAGNMSGSSSVVTASSSSSSAVSANPTSAAAEEAVRNFFADVYENYVKATMNPFYQTNAPLRSPIFRERVVTAGRKYL